MTRSRCESTNGLSGTETRSTLEIVSSGEILSMGESLNERFGRKTRNNDSSKIKVLAKIGASSSGQTDSTSTTLKLGFKDW